jgi:hypothetical protein
VILPPGKFKGVGSVILLQISESISGVILPQVEVITLTKASTLAVLSAAISWRVDPAARENNEIGRWIRPPEKVVCVDLAAREHSQGSGWRVDSTAGEHTERGGWIWPPDEL